MRPNKLLYVFLFSLFKPKSKACALKLKLMKNKQIIGFSDTCFFDQSLMGKMTES